jgi:hypothetical protein
MSLATPVSPPYAPGPAAVSMERGEHRGGGLTASIRADREEGRRCPPPNTTSLLRATPRVCAQKEPTCPLFIGRAPEPDQTIDLKARPHLTIGSHNRSGWLRRTTTVYRAPGRRASSGTGSRCRSQYRLACRGPVRAAGSEGRSGQDPRSVTSWLSSSPQCSSGVSKAALPGWGVRSCRSARARGDPCPAGTWSSVAIVCGPVASRTTDDFRNLMRGDTARGCELGREAGASIPMRSSSSANRSSIAK